MVKFNLASSALHICIFSMRFVHIYQKHNFVHICTPCKSDTRQKCIFDVICHVIFYLVFFRAETVHGNDQCYHCGNLMHIYVIFSYSIILKIIICKSAVTVFIT